MNSQTKICTKCGNEKPFSEFARNGKDKLHSACKQCARDAAKEWRQKNPEIAKAIDKAKHEKNRVARLEKMRQYHQAHAEKRSLAEKARYAENSETIKAKRKEYRDKNKSMVLAWNGSRRAAEKRATPLWVDYSGIAWFYSQAALLTKHTGEQHHVDHIIPLKGKTVSGLHVQDNLRVLTAIENLRKGASFCDADS